MTAQFGTDDAAAKTVQGLLRTFYAKHGNAAIDYLQQRKMAAAHVVLQLTERGVISPIMIKLLQRAVREIDRNMRGTKRGNDQRELATASRKVSELMKEAERDGVSVTPEVRQEWSRQIAFNLDSWLNDSTPTVDMEDLPARRDSNVYHFDRRIEAQESRIKVLVDRLSPDLEARDQLLRATPDPLHAPTLTEADKSGLIDWFSIGSKVITGSTYEHDENGENESEEPDA